MRGAGKLTYADFEAWLQSPDKSRWSVEANERFVEFLDYQRGLDVHGIGYDPDWGEARFVAHDPGFAEAGKRAAMRFDADWARADRDVQSSAPADRDAPEFDR